MTVNRDGDTIQFEVGVANVGDDLYDSQVIIDFIEEIKDQVRTRLAWNSNQGGLNLTWEVLESPLTEEATIEVYFANGTGYDNRLGTRIFSHTIPANTQPGTGAPVRIDGELLARPPEGTTHFIAFNSPLLVGSIPDVTLGYGPNVVRETIFPELIAIIKGGQRVNGVANARITSGLRTPGDQARIMFNNIRRTGVEAQMRLYGPNGRAVIQVYVDETIGMTAQQINENAATIRAAMEAEINRLGPGNVSQHCGDPEKISVVDVAYGNSRELGNLFINYVTPRVSRFIDEPHNRCYHIELLAEHRYRATR